jgi:hypothetical protein
MTTTSVSPSLPTDGRRVTENKSPPQGRLTITGGVTSLFKWTAKALTFLPQLVLVHLPAVGATVVPTGTKPVHETTSSTQVAQVYPTFHQFVRAFVDSAGPGIVVETSGMEWESRDQAWVRNGDRCRALAEALKAFGQDDNEDAPTVKILHLDSNEAGPDYCPQAFKMAETLPRIEIGPLTFDRHRRYLRVISLTPDQSPQEMARALAAQLRYSFVQVLRLPDGEGSVIVCAELTGRDRQALEHALPRDLWEYPTVLQEQQLDEEERRDLQSNVIVTLLTTSFAVVAYLRYRANVPPMFPQH